MDNSKLLKIYFGLILLDFFFLFFELDLAHFITVSLVAPIILLIYFRTVKAKFELYFIIVLLSNYYTDILHFFAKQDINNMFCAYPNVVAYLALTFIVVKNLEIKKFKDLDALVYLSFVIVAAFFVYLSWVAYTVISYQNIDQSNYDFLFFYIVLMFVMSILVTLKYIIKPNLANTNLELLMACFVISDLFYLMNLIYPEIILFRYFYIIPQLLLYYFLLKFELNRNKIFEII